MTRLLSPAEFQVNPTLTVNVRSLRLTAAQFRRICSDNRDLRLELTSTGDLIVMPPAGASTGLLNFKLIAQLAVWVERDGSGYAFDSSAGFTLPNGSIRSPDASWLRGDRWAELTNQEESFAPICPDFVVEIRSPGQSLGSLLEKMQEYQDNGARLGWLIDPIDRRVYVFSQEREPTVLEDPVGVSAEPVLVGFHLQVQELW